MATYTPKATWHQEISLINPTDRVQGSDTGAANIPHQELADSAAFLLARVIALETGAGVTPPVDYGSWVIKPAVDAIFNVGSSPSFDAQNDKKIIQPLQWSASIYNVDAQGDLNERLAIASKVAGISGATGNFTASIGEIPELVKSNQTISQSIVITLNWGGVKDGSGNYLYTDKIIVPERLGTPEEPEEPPIVEAKPTDDFTAAATHTGVVGEAGGAAVITGILNNSILDGDIGVTAQFIHYKPTDPLAENYYQKTVKKTAISAGLWTTGFDLMLKDEALVAAGTQANIIEISYLFSIDGQTDWQRMMTKYTK